MHILDLAPELLDNILYFSILSRSRDFGSALRLKLVCSKQQTALAERRPASNHPTESFYSAFRPALFATKVLESLGPWNSLQNSGADVFWHDYLVYRCRNERDMTVCRFVEIRNVTKALLGHCKIQGVDHDYDELLGEVCRLALLEHSIPAYRGRRRGWDDLHQSANRVPNLGLNLLSAATYFGYADLVQDLLSQGHDPTQDDLFPVPMYLATWTGQPAMLQLLREHLPESKDQGGPRPEFEPWSLLGAAARGDMDMVRLALDPPSHTFPPSDDSHDGDEENGMDSAPGNGLTPKQIQLGGKLGNYVRISMSKPPSGKDHQHLRNLVRESDIDSESKSREAEQMAEARDIVMVRYLLDKEADKKCKELLGGEPLVYAVKSRPEAVAAA